jgi:hypothetical protein
MFFPIANMSKSGQIAICRNGLFGDQRPYSKIIHDEKKQLFDRRNLPGVPLIRSLVLANDFFSD